MPKRLTLVTVERESKELNALQEDLARHMGKKPIKLLSGQTHATS